MIDIKKIESDLNQMEKDIQVIKEQSMLRTLKSINKRLKGVLNEH